MAGKPKANVQARWQAGRKGGNGNKVAGRWRMHTRAGEHKVGGKKDKREVM